MESGLTVHQHSLCDVIRVVSGDDVLNVQRRSTPVKCLSPEHTTKRTVVLLADLRDDRIHCPSVKLIIG